MEETPDDLAGHPDRLRWNEKYGNGFTASFAPHPLAVAALALDLPDGPVADLASGPSGSVLLAAARGRPVTAVDVSEVALALLGREARRRGLDHLVTLVHADLQAWRPAPGRYALVLGTGFWDPGVFAAAAAALAPRGVLGWEAFTTAARRDRPALPAAWCLGPGSPATLLPDGVSVISQEDVPGDHRGTRHRGTRRRLLARRAAQAS